MITTTVIFDHRKSGRDDVGVIEVRCIINRKAYYISTGVRVCRKNFVGGSVVNQPDAPELNVRLRIVMQRVTDEINRALDAGESIDMRDVRRRSWMAADESASSSSAFLDWSEKQIENLRLKAGTMKHYQTLILRLQQYGKLMRWSDLTIENLYAWDAWLHKLPARSKLHQIAAQKNAKNNRFDYDASTNEYISEAAVYNNHKCLKALLNRAVEFGHIERNPYDRLKGKFKRGDHESVDYLTEEEMLAFIETTPPTGSMMDVAHDLFIFQMFTGLAYTDAQHFNISSYKQENGRWVHIGERVKTGVPYVSVLLPPAIAVLEKYGMNVPKLGNADYNQCLKALAMVAGIKTPLHSHVARHTFATYMLRNGAQIHNVSAMLGHTNIKQTQRYAKVLAQSLREDFTRIEEKLTKLNFKTKNQKHEEKPISNHHVHDDDGSL